MELNKCCKDIMDNIEINLGYIYDAHIIVKSVGDVGIRDRYIKDCKRVLIDALDLYQPKSQLELLKENFDV